MLKHSNRIIASIVILFVSIFALSACGKQTQDKNINVTASTNFYGEVAKDVLGNHGTVTSIINSPNVDPHDYQATPQTAKQIAKSNIAVFNGLNYDSWMNKLLSNNSNPIKQFNVGNKLMSKNNSDNPHIWYSTKTMPKLADNLSNQYSKKDPKHKSEYYNNAQKYNDSLKPMLNTVNEIKKTNGNKKVDVSEPIANYALQEMGLKVNDDSFAKSIEHESDPTPSDIANVQEDIKEHKISFFLYNSQASDKVVNNLVNLAKENNVPIVSVRETLPKDKNYKQWMISQFQQILKIQKQNQIKSHK